MRKLALFGCIFFAIPTALLAQTNEDWKLCRGNDERTGVPACSRLVSKSGLPRKERAEAQAELASYFEHKDPARAIVEYGKSIAIDPTFSIAYNNRAGVYNAQQKYDLAITDAAKSIELDPSTASGYVRRAYAYFKTDRLVESIADYNKALEINPNYMWAYFERGDVQKTRGDIDKAASDYLKASKLVPQGRREDEALFIRTVDRLLSINHIDDTAVPISRITDKETNLKLRVLRAYEKLWSNASVSAALAPDLQQRREITRSQAESEKYPSSLNLKRWVLEALIDNKRYSDAEKLGYEVLATLAAYNDTAEYEPWFRYDLARALLEQGKLDKAELVMKPVTAALIPLNNDIGPHLNYGHKLASIGRYREAIALVKKWDVDHGDWGHSRMVIRLIRACSEYALGNPKQAGSIVTRMVQQASANELDDVIDGLICTDQDDRAAEAFVKLLQSQPTKLIEYQGCTDTDPELEHWKGYLRILERREVRTMIEQIGRIHQGC